MFLITYILVHLRKELVDFFNWFTELSSSTFWYSASLQGLSYFCLDMVKGSLRNIFLYPYELLQRIKQNCLIWGEMLRLQRTLWGNFFIAVTKYLANEGRKVLWLRVWTICHGGDAWQQRPRLLLTLIYSLEAQRSECWCPSICFLTHRVTCFHDSPTK